MKNYTDTQNKLQMKLEYISTSVQSLSTYKTLKPLKISKFCYSYDAHNCLSAYRRIKIVLFFNQDAHKEQTNKYKLWYIHMIHIDFVDYSDEKNKTK